MSPTKREELDKNKKELTKRKILEASMKLILENGPTAFKTEDVAELAGVSKGSVFHHFENKENLLMSTLEHILIEVEHQIFQDEENDNPVVSLSNSLQIVVEMSIESPNLMLLFFKVIDSFSEESSTKMINAFSRVFDEYLSHLTKIFEKIGVEKPDVYARIFLALIDGLGLHISLMKDSFDLDLLENIVKVATNMFSKEV